MVQWTMLLLQQKVCKAMRLLVALADTLQ